MNTFKTLVASATLILVTSLAQAHVTLEYQVAPANSTYKATFKVGHGCSGSATRQIVVQLPEGVPQARPMPKAGWNVAVQAGQVSWTARTPADHLPDAFYDEFALQARLPAQAGPLYWRVSQVCEQGRIDWAEVPQAGQKLSDLRSPAAVLEVLPAGAGGHHH